MSKNFSTPTGVGAIPTVYNADTLLLKPDGRQSTLGGAAESDSGKASILNIPSIGSWTRPWSSGVVVQYPKGKLKKMT